MRVRCRNWLQGHTLCGPPPGPPCHFLSFGINDDPSWDIEVANRWGCRGFAGDPTVSLPSKIHPNVTFHNIGATVLQDNEERLNDKGGAGEWWMTSFPRLRYFLGLERIDVLKIDCEGCEVAMSRDILREDPGFLFHVDQISIETHVTRTWMTSREHVYYFALMFPLLEEPPRGGWIQDGVELGLRLLQEARGGRLRSRAREVRLALRLRALAWTSQRGSRRVLSGVHLEALLEGRGRGFWLWAWPASHHL